MAYPTGTFEDSNVPEGVITNMSAGQGVIFGEAVGAIELPGSPPSTSMGWIKNLSLKKEAEVLTFEQGMPQELVNQIDMAKKVTLGWEGFEWDLDYFQLLEGNEAVDNSSVPGSLLWGVGGEATKQHAKFLIFHKLLNGRFVWISIWNAVGNGNFELTFPDNDWFKVPNEFNLQKGTNDFDGVALTKNYYFRIEETNFQTP